MPGRDAGRDEMDEPFRLERPKPRKVKVAFDGELLDRTKQGVLFGGADCLAGQQDLFQGDGPKEK